ncbi:MAG TPA: T9SS-dependent M36 family metallopeptidase [Flavobacteriaceae bacterium]|nr:T9SS-dependent M36 family metallopeptidase [Flavobacteriaceae bacterium]
MKKTYPKLLMIIVVLCSISTYGQQDYVASIQRYLEKNKSEYGLSSSDFSDLKVVDHYYTESMDLENVYAIQEINNLPVFNAIGSFAIKNGEVVYFGNSFQSNLRSRANGATPTLSPVQAVLKAAQALDLSQNGNLAINSHESTNEYILSKGGISLDEIPVKLVYQPTENGNIRLAWDLSIRTTDGLNWWSVRVDAQNGKILDRGNWVVSCSFPENTANFSSKNNLRKKQATKSVVLLDDGSQYNIFPLPVESPQHGDRSIVSNPANDTASPYGWHDIDGAAGAEFTITRGNNVYAYENRDGDDQVGYSPNGGPTLNFDFPLNLDQDPEGYLDAAVTNLFYMNNMMHDIWYVYGFTEPAGNFQNTNYSTFGQGNDYVIAKAQDGADLGPGNNANFATPPDGNHGFMRMFTWDPPAGTPEVLTINSPSGLAGSYSGTLAGFGPEIPFGGITSDFALVVDDNSAGTSTDPNDGCDVITNSTSVSGKIAVIRRGDCQFDFKVMNAQNSGAIGVIIVNNESGLITMAGDDPAVTIPAVLIGMADGEAIIAALAGGNTVNGTIINGGPFQKDGDLDNGVVAHEFGHGISNRLTGGPAQAGCLQNDEQMGEGWSDFFGLVITIEPGDEGTDARGYATYVINQPVTGVGLRQFRYSTDMSVNPFTYGDVPSQFNVRGSHGVGSIWATILWDLNWALIDQYGFDPDIYNGNGGNNIAMQLVIDGLKLQPCSPGFVDGRDAILAADMAENGGANQCLIWSVFARRGVGYGASQGSSFNAFDQVEAFDMPPTSVLDCTGWGTTGFEEDYFQMYPNPTHGTVNIASSKIQGEVQVNLFDINGRKVIGRIIDMNGTATLDVSGLSSGIYVVQFISDEKTQTEKLIVQ